MLKSTYAKQVSDKKARDSEEKEYLRAGNAEDVLIVDFIFKSRRMKRILSNLKRQQKSSRGLH